MYQSVNSFYENLNCNNASNSITPITTNSISNNSISTNSISKNSISNNSISKNSISTIKNKTIQGEILIKPNTNLNTQLNDSLPSDPKVWGPSLWFFLHVSSAYYPLDPSPIVRERMKNRILALPYEIPCEKCRTHALAFIEGNRDNLNDIVSTREKLFNFYVDFHNKVNERYGKDTWTYKKAFDYYRGKSI